MTNVGPDAGQGGRGTGVPSYMPTDPRGADNGGGTYTGTSRQPAIADYESVFGPGARDIKEDPMRNKRHQRWHLPDVLKGPNPYLTDRVDGLITDTTNSPFTTTMLPYTFLEHPDAKIKWNVWSFDEGMANRVPYESAARVLTQSKQSFAGYTVRQGLAITMEHNFMMSPEGRVNFSNQLKQMVGSIQYTNDLDVHVALITAPSYARRISERYYARDKNVWQRCREYVDLFGIMQKNPNALDILIEETKATLKSWGSQEPSFLMTNSKLTMQLTMTPERTQYLTQGADGVKRLRDGPNLTKYRGLDVVHSRSFATETGARPRDLLDRRVRVAEYYVVPKVTLENMDKIRVQMYDQSKDTMFTLTASQLFEKALLKHEIPRQPDDGHVRGGHPPATSASVMDAYIQKLKAEKAAGSDGGSDGARHRGGSTRGGHDGSTKRGHATSHGADVIPDEIVHENWEELAQAAQAQSLSTWDYMLQYTCYTDAEKKHGYSTSNAITYQCGQRGENGADQMWIDGSMRFTNEFVPGKERLPMNLVPYNALINYLSQDMHMSEEAKKIMEDEVVGKTLKYGMGWAPSDNTAKAPNMHYKNSRLFFMNAYCLAINTGDLKAFKRDSMKEYTDEIVEMMNHEVVTFIDSKPLAPKPTYTKFQHADADDVSYKEVFMGRQTLIFNGAISTSMQWLNVIRFMMHDLFGNHSITDNTGLEGITMQANAGAVMGVQAASSKPDFMSHATHENKQTHGGKPSEGTHRAGGPGAGDGSTSKNEDQEKFAAVIRGEFDIIMIRPNIEHNMLGVIMGRGGTEDLGATFWGQTELSVYDDGMHGKWGMSYKYHERAMVLNEKNLIRTWDVAFNGYNGGCDDQFVDWSESSHPFCNSTNTLDKPYDGPSIICMMIPHVKETYPNPILLSSHDGSDEDDDGTSAFIDPENINSIFDPRMQVFGKHPNVKSRYDQYMNNLHMPDFSMLHATRKTAGASSNDSLTEATSVAFQGTVLIDRNGDGKWEHTRGAGHLGDSYVGVASVREGKGFKQDSAPQYTRMM